jgi:16S rRNA (guanine(966)-N(2))-methyltransferase RsmD
MMPKLIQLKHQIRIIAGQYRRRLLPVITAPDYCQLRPTPNRVRQTLFNWVDHFINDWQQMRVVDAFAGTGALGLEAASRGAKQVILCESYKPAAHNLQNILTILQAAHCTVNVGDALAMLSHLPPSSIDVLLLDPPFYSELLNKVQELLPRVLAHHALVYIESEVAISWADYTVLRHTKMGLVHAQLLQFTPNTVNTIDILNKLNT